MIVVGFFKKMRKAEAPSKSLTTKDKADYFKINESERIVAQASKEVHVTIDNNGQITKIESNR